MIQIDKLTKCFGDFTAVNDLSLQLKPGDILGFLGPNGAGKSTTMKMLTGFLTPDSGSISVNGTNLEDDELLVKQQIGDLPEGAPAYGDMTPAQFLNFIAEVRGLTGATKKQRIAQVIDDVELHSVLNRPIDNLSKGFKRRVGLAQAIIHDPKVLILDEPTDGLDPNQKHQVRGLIESLSADKIVIISTHILEEVTAVCNRAVIIANGKKLFDGSPDELEAQSKYNKAITIKFASQPKDISSLENLPLVEQVIYGEADAYMSVIPNGNSEELFPQIINIIKQQDWLVEAIHLERGQLDEVFRKLTTETA